MEQPFERVVAELDGVGRAAMTGAFPGAHQRLAALERSMIFWLDARGRPDAAAAEQLWKLFIRVRAAVERRDAVGASSSLEDLRDALVALHSRGSDVAPTARWA
jgi:hypothetical protein